ncbi:MAG: protein kinase [Massilia sp.]|nr:protein kinase [Massilia sp.]
MADRLEQIQRAFGAYSIERELGSGGMATVYLAHDTKHDRKVAIKVLHAELAAVLGAERFLQEITVTANLQHPHILGLIDSGIIGEGELQGRPYYVMPFVSGESLRQRLDKEQQLPVRDAVRIASEVANALDYAHRQGVIHRDIKPENILLHDGSAIVADFGIALAVTQAGGARMTQTGLSLGTPSYMSPEQAMGERTITARSDIYSLGAVTYEMLSGEPPFTGPTVQAVVARVMTEEPRALTAQRRNVPPNVAAAVAHALEKVPADRFGSAHEFAEALNDPSFALSAASTSGTRSRSTRRPEWLFYAVCALAILGTGTSLWAWMRPAPPKPVLRYTMVFDSAEAMLRSAEWGGRLAISPDGSRLAYIGGPGAQLLIRSRNELHATAIPGTEGAYTPFFSPDGQRVGIITGQNLQIVSVGGGAPVTVTDSLVDIGGASWGPDGFIYADGAGFGGLMRVEAKPRAVPKLFTALDTAGGEIDHMWPAVLPNGKGVLFTDTFGGASGSKTKSTYTIAVAEIPSGKHRVILENAIYARYATSGHLLYVTPGRTVMMVAFDQSSMKVTGEPTTLVEGMRLGPAGSTDLAVSETGTLVYGTSTGTAKEQLVWITRDGKASPVDPGWEGEFLFPTISPDGRQLAVVRKVDAQTIDLWIKQLDRGPSIKLTEGGSNVFPTWKPDGQSVTFSSNRAGSHDLWTKRADGSAPAVLQFSDKRSVFGARWSPDGTWLIYQTDGGEAGLGDILGVRPGSDRTPVPLVATRFTEVAPSLSPDGRWLAYTSNESGRYEIYVVPFPNTGAAKWAISTRGGTEPQWSHSGKELFYRDREGNLVAVTIRTMPAFSIGGSTALFSAAAFASDEFGAVYAVAPDDQRFLMIRANAANGSDQLIVVDNWFEELRSRARK